MPSHKMSAYVFAGSRISKREPSDMRLFSDIVSEISLRYKINPEQLKNKSRKRTVVEPRQLIVILARELTKLSYKYIGEQLGGFDHSTMVQNHNRIKDLIDTEPELREIYNDVKLRL